MNTLRKTNTTTLNANLSLKIFQQAKSMKDDHEKLEYHELILTHERALFKTTCLFTDVLYTNLIETQITSKYTQYN
jgi:hypothetical protein